ncbi:MAG TPA: multiheme c-type cytochrome [Candidatus Deferrimicrobiaceae bacterium]
MFALLLLPAFLAFFRVLPASAELEGDFNDPRKCASCHAGIFEQWDGSMHALAVTDNVFRKFYEMVVEEAGPAAVEFCMKCHTPVGVARKELPPVTGEKLDNVAIKGVFCDFCHTVTPLGIGNAAFDTTHSTTKKGPFDNSVSPAHATKTDNVYRSSDFCGMCHNVTHPISGRPIERTWQEWKDSPYNTGDPATSTACQDCHMRQTADDPATGDTPRKDNPGKAASMGPERPHVWTHYFVGGGALYPDSPNGERRKAMAMARLRHAAKVDIEIGNIPDYRNHFGSFRVRVTNVGAGHKLPTGLSEVREMWLDVTVTDAKGKVLLRSGAIGENGGIDPSAAIFKTFLGIGRSNVKLSCCFFAIGERNKIMSAEKITRDRRILPKGYDEEKYAFEVPKGAALPITIDAKLNYRSMSQDFANIFFPDGTLKVPVIRMGEATARICPGGSCDDGSLKVAPGKKKSGGAKRR